MKTRARRAMRIRLDLSELEPSPSAPRFLGRLDSTALRRELDDAGVLSALEARGYPDPEIRIDEHEGEHRVVVAPCEGGESLIELRMAEGGLPVNDPALRDQGIEVLSVLSVHWLSLQDPRDVFTAERPPLPGQRHPGLRLGRQLYLRVIGWAAAWGKDALLNYPEYFHNARFYAPPFSFLSPAEQGRFEALCRDLAALPVAEASGAVEAGRVVDDSTGEPVEWAPGEMIAPVTEPVRRYLAGAAYRDAAAATRDAHRFRVVPAP